LGPFEHEKTTKAPAQRHQKAHQQAIFGKKPIKAKGLMKNESHKH
jgi:hypothetical protein